MVRNCQELSGNCDENQSPEWNWKNHFMTKYNGFWKTQFPHHQSDSLNRESVLAVKNQVSRLAISKKTQIDVIKKMCMQLAKWPNRSSQKNKHAISKMTQITNCDVFCFVFHVVCKISNFNKWTAKHLAQASCTELTLPRHDSYIDTGHLFRTSPTQRLVFKAYFLRSRFQNLGIFWEPQKF